MSLRDFARWYCGTCREHMESASACYWEGHALSRRDSPAHPYRALLMDTRDMGTLCEMGHHGAHLARKPWTYEGTCAYLLKSLDGTLALCKCDCHGSAASMLDAMREWHIEALDPTQEGVEMARCNANLLATIDQHYYSGIAGFIRDENDRRYLASTAWRFVGTSHPA